MSSSTQQLPAKVVLFYPNLFTPAQMKTRGYSAEGENIIPLSLLAVARPLVKQGYRVVIINEVFEDDPVARVLGEMEDAVCLGISALSGYHIAGGLKVAAAVKARFPGKPVIWGGWHVTTLPDETLESALVDAVVRGQGEDAFLELVQALEAGRDWSQIGNLSYKKDGVAVHNPRRPYNQAINEEMFPYELLDMEQYFKHVNVPADLDPKQLTRPMVIITSYGCAWNCGFCGHKIQYDCWHPMSAQRVVDELEFLVKKYGINYFLPADGDPMLNEKRMNAILDGMEQRGLKLRWECTARADDLVRYSDETLLRMKALGMGLVHVGIEHGVDRLLKLMNKGTTRATNEAAVEKLARLGIPMYGNFIFGLPTETREELLENVNFMIWVRSRSRENIVSYMFYMPLAGTSLYELALQHGFVPPKSLEEWSKFTFSLKLIQVPWLSQEMTGILQALNMIFLPLAYPDEDRQQKWDSRAIAPLYRLAARWARFRIERRWFGLLFEPALVEHLHTRPLLVWQRLKRGLQKERVF